MIYVTVELLMFEHFTRGRPDREEAEQCEVSAPPPEGDARIENHQKSISRLSKELLGVF